MDDAEKYLRKTSIIATIGPKTNTVEMLQELRTAGMNIGVFFFSTPKLDLSLVKGEGMWLLMGLRGLLFSPNELFSRIVRVPPERH